MKLYCTCEILSLLLLNIGIVTQIAYINKQNSNPRGLQTKFLLNKGFTRNMSS